MKTREDIRVSIRRILVDYQICDDCDLQKAEDDILGLIDKEYVSLDSRFQSEHPDLKELEKRLDDSLAKETPKSMNEFLSQDKHEMAEDFPDIDFRIDIANELSRDELIERLCEMNKTYREMRKEWFEKTQLNQSTEGKTETAENILTNYDDETKSLMEKYGVTESDVDAALKNYINGHKEANQSTTEKIGAEIKTPEEILSECSCIPVNELNFKNEVRIIRPSEAIEAIRNFASQFQREKVTDEEYKKVQKMLKLQGPKENRK